MKARVQLYKREEAYRFYLTGALKILTENTVHHISLNGVADIGVQMQERYYDILNPSTEEKQIEEKEDNRSAVEFAAEMLKRATKSHKKEG